MNVTTLDGYLMQYGSLLGLRAKQNLAPLHEPGRDKVHPLIKKLLRKPYPAQAQVVTACAKTLCRQKALFLVGEMGVGKTLLGQSAIHCHANGRPYRALVFCPGQLTRKWAREILSTIPDATVTVIETCSDLLPLVNSGKPTGSHWFIIGRDRAKLGPGWEPAAVKRTVEYKTQVKDEDGETHVVSKRGEILFCPSCSSELRKTTEKDPVGRPLMLDNLSKNPLKCEKCKSPLWQNVRKPDRFEPARFIHKRLRGFFKYLIVDEAHEEGKADSAQANAVGSLSAAATWTIAMTGTLIGGMAEHMRPLLFRLCPGTIVAEGFKWSESMPFTEKYGRVETVITERQDGGASNKQSRGSSTNKTKYCRPGIMPTLFGAHLIGNAVFLGLEEMHVALPSLKEFVIPVTMDSELKLCYTQVESILKDTLKQMLARRDRRLLGAMLQTLMAYPDHPFAWQTVGYRGHDGFIPVVDPPNLSSVTIRPKERKLLDIVRAEYTLGRQVWVYVQLNGKHDVEIRLAGLLEREGFRTKVLKHTIKLAEREEWIDQNCADVDVVLSHPKLVETGLDLFSKSYLGHNFCTLVFYETGYVLPTMRQASRRAWRLMQPKECKVYYLYYEKTMQERAMQLMGKKLLAAEALEGKFSSEGLVAMAGDDGVEMALAKSLSETMDEAVDRNWKQGLSSESNGRRTREQEAMVIE